MITAPVMKELTIFLDTRAFLDFWQGPEYLSV